MSTRTTIKDVAELSRTSLGSVSRYINYGKGNPEQQQRIREAIKQLGYVPNIYARATRSTRTHAIAIIISDRQMTTHFWMQATLMAMMVNGSTKRNRYFVQVLEQENETPQQLRLPGNVDGVILFGRFKPDFYQQLQDCHIPAVTFWSNLPAQEGYSWAVNLELAMAKLVDHLMELGHRNIGMVGFKCTVNMQKRKDFIHQLKLRIPDYDEKRCIIETEEVNSCGETGTQKLWEQFPDTTAVFYLADNTALQAIGTFQKMKLLIPQEVSIVSFDNSHLALNTNPTLTAVGFDYEELANGLMRQLDDIIEAKHKNTHIAPFKEPLNLKFYPRKSTGRARHT